MITNMKPYELFHIVQGMSYGAGGSGEDYVSLKEHEGVLVVVYGDNGSTVSGGGITFKQATAVAGTGEKALSFPASWLYNTDLAAGDTMTESTASSLTPDTTNSKDLLYLFYFRGEDLDAANGFDCFRIDIAARTNGNFWVAYILGPAKNARALHQTAITD